LNTLRHTPLRAFREAAAVFAVAAVGYTLLLSQMLVDDAPRYLDELGSNRFHWDLGHVWMQPLALLLYRGPLHFLGVNHALEAVNVISVAVGAAVFHATLRRLGHGRVKALLATALVAVSFNLISLGPTAHIKLMVFPTLALSLREAVLWESAALQGRLATGRAAAAGLWLGAGTTLLVSVLPAALFVTLFMLLRACQAGASGARLLAAPAAFAVGFTAAGTALTLAAYATAVATASTEAHGVLAFVIDGLREKESLHVPFTGWLEVPFRFVFSLIYNFVFMPSLGALGRAWLWGMLPGIGEHALVLVAQTLAALLSIGALTSIIALGALSVRRSSPALLLAFAYVLGAAAFSSYYNLNDPEHWFQFTLPITFIAVQARRRWLDVLVLGIWLPVMAVANLGFYGIPKAAFDLEGRQRAFQSALGPRGLYVGFAAYPGEPDSSLLSTAGAPHFYLDRQLAEDSHGDVALTIQRLDKSIEATFERGGRVLVFRALDDSDWRGPVMQTAQQGLTRALLRQHLVAHYRVQGPMEVAGFAAWEVLPRSGAR
jgi:hypothetical protein